MKKAYLTPTTHIADFKVCEPLLKVSKEWSDKPEITTDPNGTISGGGLVRPWHGNFNREEW